MSEQEIIAQDHVEDDVTATGCDGREMDEAIAFDTWTCSCGVVNLIEADYCLNCDYDNPNAPKIS